MKKRHLISIMLFSMLMASFIGCSNSEPNTVQSIPTKEIATNALEPTIEPTATPTTEPTATPTTEPTATPTTEPTATPTTEPTATPTTEPTDVPVVTDDPEPTLSLDELDTQPEPSQELEPTDVPITDFPTPTPVEEVTPIEEPTPEPTPTDVPVVTKEPEVTKDPVITKEPEVTKEPVVTKEPEVTKEPTPTPVEDKDKDKDKDKDNKDKDTKDTKDNKNGTKVSKEYDVNHFKPFKEVTSTFNTVKLSDSFGSGDFSFKSGQLILGDVYSGVFSSWLAENSLFGEQDAFDFLSEEQIAEFNKINIIPTISKTNTKGLTTETILGSKEEATEILDAWLEARNAKRINSTYNAKVEDSVYYNHYGVTSYTIEDDGNILFKSYSGTKGIGVNTEKFGEPVYSVGLYATSDGQMDDKDIADQKLADIEILSLISNDPYDLCMKLFDGDKKNCLAYTVYDKWYRINDMLIYRDSNTGNIYMKPVS